MGAVWQPLCYTQVSLMLSSEASEQTEEKEVALKTVPLLEARSSRPVWPTWQNPVSAKKSTKINQVWWHTLVIPATREAEAGKLLEPGRQRLQ